MNHQALFPHNRLGLALDMRSILDNRRRRAAYVGKFQLMVSGCIIFTYCFLSDKVFENITKLQNSLNEQYKISRRNETSNSSYVLWNVFEFETPIDLIIFKAKVTIGLYIITAILHLASSIMVLYATQEGFTISRAITFCKWALVLNFAFHMSDILVYISSVYNTQATFVLILYRYWFHQEVSGLLRMLESLAPPPPGHQ